MSALKNSTHENLVMSFLKFFRDREAAHSIELNSFFDDCRDMRLIQKMYTKEELTEYYDCVKDLATRHITDNLEKYSDQTLGFMKMVLLQAEGQDVEIAVSTSDLENGEWLEEMAGIDLDKGRKTQTGDAGAGAKLSMKINELKEDRDRTGNRLDKLDAQLRRTEQDNDDLEGDKKALKNQLRDLQDDLDDLPNSALLKEIRKLRADLLDIQEENNEALGPLRDEVSKYREELAERVAGTTQFQQLLKMTQQKNKQIRELRDEA